MRIVNFLDKQFHLNNGTYQPHRTPDNTPDYINKKSNHAPVVLKQLPKSIAKRISDISSDENIFCNSIPIYSEALKKMVLITNQNFLEACKETIQMIFNKRS